MKFLKCKGFGQFPTLIDYYITLLIFYVILHILSSFYVISYAPEILFHFRHAADAEVKWLLSCDLHDQLWSQADLV